MQCLILAGGLGTRMQSVAPDLPKTLVPVNGRPFADYQLTWLRREGVRRVVYAIGYQGEAIRAFVGDGGDWNLEVAYCDEGDARLGTAGAVRLALDGGLLDPGFFVLYGDSFLRIDLQSVWRHADAGETTTLSVFRNDGLWDASNAVVADGRVQLYEKGRTDARSIGMDFIDYGLSVLNHEVIREYTRKGEAADLADVYHHLSRSGRLRAYEADTRFFEVGSPSGHAALEAFLRAQETPE